MAKDWGRDAWPCKTCIRTKYPQTCDNKCPDWIDWFIRSWDELREILKGYIQEDKDGEESV
jgi:predicted metal-binding protein